MITAGLVTKQEEEGAHEHGSNRRIARKIESEKHNKENGNIAK